MTKAQLEERLKKTVIATNKERYGLLQENTDLRNQAGELQLKLSQRLSELLESKTRLDECRHIIREFIKR